MLIFFNCYYDLFGIVIGVFVGFGYLLFYFVGKLSFFDRRGYILRVFWVLFFVLVVGLIGIIWVNDY